MFSLTFGQTLLILAVASGLIARWMGFRWPFGGNGDGGGGSGSEGDGSEGGDGGD